MQEMLETRVHSLGWEDLLEKEFSIPNTPVFLLEESHGQRSLAGYSPQDPKELDTTKATYHACMHTPLLWERGVLTTEPPRKSQQ